MAVARGGGGGGGRNSFAIYWLKLVSLGTIRFWWKFRFIEIDVALNLLLWFLFFLVGF